MTGIITAALLVGGVGLVIGILLSIAAKVFAVKVDANEIAIREVLPGNNCGGCGYAGCDGLAKAIAAGEAPVGACPVGGSSVAEQIGKIMGTEGEMIKKVAFVKCGGDCSKAKDKYEYTGNQSCREANYVSGGPKGCTYGCMGFGSCVQVCEFDAISIVDGIAVVDKEKCVACGKCVKECPKGLISLVPYTAKHLVQCNSKEKGKEVMSVCSAGCIGCSLCAKNCPKDAIVFENNLAVIDYDKCVNCGICAQKCPKKIIL